MMWVGRAGCSCGGETSLPLSESEDASVTEHDETIGLLVADVLSRNLEWDGQSLFSFLEEPLIQIFQCSQNLW